MSASQPLDGLSVLSCRQLGRGESLDNQVREAGGAVVRLPLIEVRPPDDEGVALKAALARLGSYDWIACTSVNGVEALAGTELPAGVRLGAVGPATAEAFERVLGRSALVVPSVHTAKGLAAGFPPRPGRVLAPLAELASTDLADGLRARGYDVDVVSAYSTAVPEVSAEALNAAARSDVVIVSSPSVAHRLADLLGEKVPAVALTLGPRSTEAASGYFDEVVEASPENTFESLVAVADRLVAGPS